MGKANRTSQADQNARRLAAEQKKQAQAAAQKTARRNKIIGIVCTVLAVALIGTTLVYNKMVSSGFFMRQNIAASTENFSMDQTHASYFYNYNYAQYSSMASYLGIDTSTSLKSQACSFMESGTWFDYFMTSAKSNMNTILLFCEEAKARGIELDDDDYAQIDAQIDELKAAAKSAGVTKTYYIHAMYGMGVSEKDIRDVLEMTQLYSKCYNEIVGAYSFDTDDYEKYAEENKTSLLQIDYATLSMTTSDATVDGDITVEMLAEYADRFAKAKNKSAFDEIAREYLTDCMYKDNESVTDEDIQEEIDGYTVTGATYLEDSEFFTWAYDDSRKVNDIYTYANEDGTAQYVYILLSTPALDETKTVNVRHILLSADSCGSDEAAQAKAEELLATWQSGAATADSFAELAKEYSEDSSAEDGGLIENIGEGETVTEFNDWIFAEGRKIGDAGVLHSDYGYHVIYMEGDGLLAWQVTADSALKSDQYSLDYARMAEEYTVTFNSAVLNAVNG